MEDYADRGINLVEVNSGFQFRSSTTYAPFVRDFVARKPVRLSRPQLETLAIVAYRQPVTRPEIDDIRGVDSGSALRILSERGLLKVLGRKEEPGRPLLYGTSPFFLEFFGMKALTELPTLQEFSELSDESRGIFEKRIGEPLDLSGINEAAKAAEESALTEMDEEEAKAIAAHEAEQAALEGDASDEFADGEAREDSDEPDRSVTEIRGDRVEEE